MSALLTCANSALPIETIPAIKIVHFNGSPKADEVYAYARIYALSGSLQFCLTRFEQAMHQDVRMGITIANIDNANTYLFLDISFNGDCNISVYENDKKINTIKNIKVQITSGTDEQGWYYSAQGTIDVNLLASVNVSLQPSKVFLCNIYSYNISETAFGAAYKTPVLTSIPTNKGVKPIVCVSY